MDDDGESTRRHRTAINRVMRKMKDDFKQQYVQRKVKITCTKLRMIFFGSVLLTANVGQPSPTHRLISLSQFPGGTIWTMN